MQSNRVTDYFKKEVEKDPIMFFSKDKSILAYKVKNVNIFLSKIKFLMI